MISRLTISVPKTLEDFARWRVRNGGFSSVSDYFRELARADRRLLIAKQEQRETTRPVREPLASATRRGPFGHR
ncbi:MAG: hypothetical protein IPL32_15340 [Chloracidobacterium sp.]|nr:hypothetical protein [Chloracidobacterium sp.]